MPPRRTERRTDISELAREQEVAPLEHEMRPICERKTLLVGVPWDATPTLGKRLRVVVRADPARPCRNPSPDSRSR